MLVCADEGSDNKSAAKTDKSTFRGIAEIGELSRLGLPESRIGFAKLLRLDRNVIDFGGLGRISSSAQQTQKGTSVKMHLYDRIDEAIGI